MLSREQMEFRANIAGLVHEAEETEDNCVELRELVERDIHFLGCRIIKPSKANHNTGEKLKSQLMWANGQIEKGINVSRDIAINMVLASCVIELGKSKFFEVIIDAYPDIICLYQDRGGINLDTPLMRAIYNNSPALVSTVLSNKHFVNHEFSNTEAHTIHVQNCQAIAIAHCTGQPEILSMLGCVLQFRIPLISAMKAATNMGDLSSVSTILSNLDFIDHEYQNPLAHKSLLNDCIECAKRWCGAQPKVLEELQKANGIEPSTECIMM